MSNKDFIIQSLKYFDQQNTKYSKYIRYVSKDLFILNAEKEKILDLRNIETLGVFYNETNVFVWGWVIPDHTITKISRSILNYGLNLDKLETNEHYFIKPLLVNSRIYIDYDYNLDLLLCVVSNLSKNKFDYIYPIVFKDINNKSIYTVYYLIKVSDFNL
jgi:hypothetical protein